MCLQTLQLGERSTLESSNEIIQGDMYPVLQRDLLPIWYVDYMYT